jgi:hypothetical protein
VDLLQWLQNLGKDLDPTTDGFQAQTLYIVLSVALPVVIGLAVGFGLRAIERVFGVELGKGGH